MKNSHSDKVTHSFIQTFGWNPRGFYCVMAICSKSSVQTSAWESVFSSESLLWETWTDQKYNCFHSVGPVGRSHTTESMYA